MCGREREGGKEGRRSVNGGRKTDGWEATEEEEEEEGEGQQPLEAWWVCLGGGWWVVGGDWRPAVAVSVLCVVR